MELRGGATCFFLDLAAVAVPTPATEEVAVGRIPLPLAATEEPAEQGAKALLTSSLRLKEKSARCDGSGDVVTPLAAGLKLKEPPITGGVEGTEAVASDLSLSLSLDFPIPCTTSPAALVKPLPKEVNPNDLKLEVLFG